MVTASRRAVRAVTIVAVVLTSGSFAAAQVYITNGPFAVGCWGLGGAFVGYGPFWRYDVPPVPVQAGPPLENAPTGGLQLDVDPRSGQVYVDGRYQGLVSDFSGYYKHLDLVAGPHFVAILARNYDPLSIPVMVPVGRTITYRATLTWAHGR
jgi:hypothetical protein